MSGQVRRTLLTAGGGGGGGVIMRRVFKMAAPLLRTRRPDKSVARRPSEWAILAGWRLDGWKEAAC